MGLSYAAMGRWPGRHRTREASAARHGVYTSTADLVALHSVAREVSFSPRRPLQSLLFSALQPHEPISVDDSEAADRTIGPQARPLGRGGHDEKVRPALIIVDQRLSMFFGLRRSMKSVAAAEAAALCVWRAVDHGGLVGGAVFNNSSIALFEPQRGGPAAMRLIEAMASQNAELRADSTQARAPSQLDAALVAAAAKTTHDHLIVVISDFYGHGPRTREHLIRLSGRNDVAAVLVYDPFLLDLPTSGDIIFSRGELQIDTEFGAGRIRRSLFDYADAHSREILAFEREIGIPVLPLSAAEEAAPQMRRLLDESFWRRMRN